MSRPDARDQARGQGPLADPAREGRAFLAGLSAMGFVLLVVLFCALHASWRWQGLLALALLAGGLLACVVALTAPTRRTIVLFAGVTLVAGSAWFAGLSPDAMGWLLSGWHAGTRPDNAQLLADFSNWGQGMGGLAVLIAVVALFFTIYQLIDQRRRDAEEDAADRQRRRLLEQSNVFAMAHSASVVLEQLRRSTYPKDHANAKDAASVGVRIEDINKLDEQVRRSLFEQIKLAAPDAEATRPPAG